MSLWCLEVCALRGVWCSDYTYLPVYYFDTNAMCSNKDNDMRTGKGQLVGDMVAVRAVVASYNC